MGKYVLLGNLLFYYKNIAFFTETRFDKPAPGINNGKNITSIYEYFYRFAWLTYPGVYASSEFFQLENAFAARTR